VPPFMLYFTLEKRHQYFLKMEQTVIIENSKGKIGRFLKKYVVTNAREVVQLTETLKQ
jgi:hypothetical protein